MNNDKIAGPVIATSKGHYFDFVNPENSVIDIEDIAHALAHICRFTGHVRCHYSVAQHSVLASHLVREEFALQALLHDAAEAYLGDVSHPLKTLLPDYKKIEKRIEKVVLNHFGLPEQLDASVKQADLIMLATEKRDLLVNEDQWRMLDGVEPMELKLRPWRQKEAEERFLEEFYFLTRKAQK